MTRWLAGRSATQRRRGVVAVGLVVFASLTAPASSRLIARHSVVAAPQRHPVTFFYPRPFARAVTIAGRHAATPMPGAMAVLVPHHWLAGSMIVEGLRDLAATRRIDRVILVGPNHIGAGGASLITSTLEWATPFSVLQPDLPAINRLIQAGIAADEPHIMSYEHSVAGIVPALRHEIPGARVVPLIVRGSIDRAGVLAAARAIADLIDARTAVVFSVDFSHYLSAAQAVRYNEETVPALKALDTRRVMGWGNEHLDSPGTIAIVMEAMRLLGATTFVVRADTNSSRIGGSGVAPNVTSYIAGYYRR